MTDRIEKLKALLELEPDDAFCLYSIAFEHTQAGETASALEYFDRTLKVDPDYCYAYYHKARAQKEAGDIDAARETLRVGLDRAKACRDEKAESEITQYLDTLS